MPIYEFQCNECGAAFESIVFSSKDQDKITCTRCKSPAIQKILSAPRLQRKTTPSLNCKPRSGFT